MSIYNTKEGWNITCEEHALVLRDRLSKNIETRVDEEDITSSEYFGILLLRLSINYDFIVQKWIKMHKQQLSMKRQVKLVRSLDKILRERHRAIFHDCIYDDDIDVHVKAILEFEALDEINNDSLSYLVEGK